MGTCKGNRGGGEGEPPERASAEPEAADDRPVGPDDRLQVEPSTGSMTMTSGPALLSTTMTRVVP